MVLSLSIVTLFALPKSFKGDWIENFIAVAKENVTISIAKVDGILEITCPGENGIEKIKKALALAESFGGETGKVKVQYVGAPKYRIVATEAEFKAAEDLIRAAANTAIEEIEKCGGSGTFERS